MNALVQRIDEAARWSESHLDLARLGDSLRTPELLPRLLVDPMSSVSSVCKARAAALKGVRPVVTQSGRLLVYFSNHKLSDGAAEAESNGWFDVDNVPPWDTWVGFYEYPATPCLLSWVPGSVEALVGRGIAVNPEHCICWLEDSKMPLRQELDAAAPHLLR